MHRIQILFLLFVFMVFRGKLHLHRLFCADINDQTASLLFRYCSMVHAKSCDYFVQCLKRPKSSACNVKYLKLFID